MNSTARWGLKLSGMYNKTKDPLLVVHALIASGHAQGWASPVMYFFVSLCVFVYVEQVKGEVLMYNNRQTMPDRSGTQMTELHLSSKPTNPTRAEFPIRTGRT